MLGETLIMENEVNTPDCSSMFGTFKQTSKAERDNILEQKDPVNTKKSTRLWMNCFNEYLLAKQLPKAEDVNLDLLPEIL